MPNLVSLTHLSFQILGKSQYLIKENYHDSRTIDGIDMRLAPVTKLDKRNNVKKIDNDVISATCDVIVILSIYGQFGAIWKLNSGCRVSKTYIFIKSNLLSCKNWKKNERISNTTLALLL